MIWVYVTLTTICVVLWVVSKIVVVSSPKVNAAYSKPFLAAAVLIYKWACLIEKNVFSHRFVKRAIPDKKISSDLQRLNPGDNSDSQLYSFKLEKISLALLLVFTGSVLGMLIAYKAVSGGVLVNGKNISRNEYGGTDINANLIAGIENENGERTDTDINLQLAAEVYTYEEADDLFNQMQDSLDEIILNENDSFTHILFPLKLAKQINGYPFSINWECENYEYVDTDGTIHNEELENPVVVNLTADCLYEHYHWYRIIPVQICPPEYTYDQLVEMKIWESLEKADKKTATESAFVLPDSIDEGSISWVEKVKDDSPLVLFGLIILLMLITPMREAEIRSELKKRTKLLLMEYPAFVSKISLYLSAGMSVRNCFLSLGKSAEMKSEKKRTYLDKELIISAHELQLGISEPEVYEKFGTRCGNREYTRFSALLIQNMKKGSTDLMRILEEESEAAFLIRKNEARKLGEEASTKLLLPMIMMLSVVMIIIMVPAYMSFSS